MGSTSPPFSIPSSHERGDRHRNKRVVIREVKKLRPDLLALTPGARIGPEDIDQFTACLTADVSPAIANERLRFLNRSLQDGHKKFGWAISLAPLYARVDRKAGPLNRDVFAELPKLAAFEKAFIATLNETPSDPVAAIGQVLICAALYGGLLAQHWWQPWLNQLHDQQFHKFRWIEMRRSRDDEVDDHRRWIADPLTDVLLRRWEVSAAKADGPVPTAAAAIIAFMTTLPRAERLSQSAFHNICLARGAIWLPGFIYDYAAGYGQSCSVQPKVWARLETGKKVRINAKLNDDAGMHQSETPEPSQVRQSSSFEDVTQLERLRGALRDAKAKPKITAASATSSIISLIKEDHPSSATMRLLCCWALERLSSDSPLYGYRKKLKYTTVCRYLGAMAQDLLSDLGPENPLTMDAIELSEIYSEVIRYHTSPRERLMRASALADFHSFLSRGRPELAVRFDEIRPGSVRAYVDANLLSNVDFNRTKQLLSKRFRTDVAMFQCCAGAAILGRRGGMRRSEVRHVLLRDFAFVDGRIYLLIANNRHRSLKSASARRRVPLYVLMDDHDTAIVQALYDRRLQEEKGRLDAVLFAVKGETDVLSDRLLFDPIRDAMRTATGDQTLRFHHLRHSTATFLLRTLMIPEGLPVYLLNYSDKLFKRGANIRVELMGANSLNQGAVHSVSALMGHADLPTTLSSYFHLADWTLAALLSRPDIEPMLPFGIIAALTGTAEASVAQAKRRREKAAKSLPLSRIAADTMGHHRSAFYKRHGYPPANFDAGEPHRRSPKIKAGSLSFPDWIDILSALKRGLAQESPAEISRVISRPVKEIAGWLQCFDTLGQGRGSLLARMKTPIVSGTFQTPNKPVLTSDIEQAASIWDKVAKLTRREMQKIDRLLEVIVRTWSDKPSGVLMTNILEAKQIVSSLALLGIQRWRLNLVVYRAPKITDAQAVRAAAIWPKELGISNADITYNRVVQKGRRPNGAVLLNVGKGLTASYGFRFTVLMLVLARHRTISLGSETNTSRSILAEDDNQASTGFIHPASGLRTAHEE